MMRLLVVCLAIWLFSTRSAPAQVPGIDLSVVPQQLPVSPDGSLAYTVTILGVSGQPISGGTVEVRFNAPGDTLTCWCSDVPDPGPPPATHSFFSVTNARGVASFHIRGGGCIPWALAAIPGTDKCAGRVYFNGVYMNEFGTVSPDAVDRAGRLPTSRSSLWDPAGACGAGLADAVRHTTPLATSSYNWCTDINGDRVCGVADAVILTPYVARAASCHGDAGSIP